MKNWFVWHVIIILCHHQKKKNVKNNFNHQSVEIVFQVF